MMKYLLILLLCPLALLGQETILTGVVWNPVDNAPVQDAFVKLFMGRSVGYLTANTDANGQFGIRHDQKALDVDYSIAIEKEGFHLLNGTVRLNYGEGQDRRFNLYRKSAPPEPEVSLEAVQGPSLVGAPTNNLVFLIDVSGSMAEQNRLADLKESLLFLVDLYRPEDRISILTYSTNVTVYLEGARIAEIDRIREIISSLEPVGRTEGAAALVRAYDVAAGMFLEDGNNKVILATDGIFAEDKKSRKLVEDVILLGRSRKIRLSILSFGAEAESVTERMDAWSRLGNGRHTHISTLEEAKEQILLEAKGQ